MSDLSDSYDSDSGGSDSYYKLEDLSNLNPSKPIEFGLFQHLDAEAAAGQGALKAYDVQETGSAVYSERKSDYSVLADRLLWVDGYETTTKIGEEIQRGQQMTLVVLKLVFKSLDPSTKLEHITATLRLHDPDKRGLDEPLVEAWAPFRTMDRSNTVVAQREAADTVEAGVQVGYSGAEVSLGRSRENKISWELTDFDQGSSNEEFSKVTNRRNGITWFLKQNNLLNQGLNPEVWVSVLFSRPSARPYVVDFSLYVRAGTLREIENKMKRFFGTKPGRTTAFSMTPWEQIICNSEGKDILKDIDRDNLGSLRDPKLRTSLNLKWGAGPAHQVGSSAPTEGDSSRPAEMIPKPERIRQANEAAGGTAQSNPSDLQVGGESWGGDVHRLAQAEARVAQAEARIAQVEARMALQDVKMLELQQKMMSLST